MIVLDIYFNSPKDFDQNFYLYFPEFEKSQERFVIINSKKRRELSDHFSTLTSSSARIYFGPNSIGKSVILIGTSKYSFDHNYLQSFI